MSKRLRTSDSQIKVYFMHKNEKGQPSYHDRHLLCNEECGSELLRNILDDSDDLQAEIVLDSELISEHSFSLFVDFVAMYSKEPFDLPRRLDSKPFASLVPSWCGKFMQIEPKSLIKMTWELKYLLCDKLTRTCQYKLACYIRNTPLPSISARWTVEQPNSKEVKKFLGLNPWCAPASKAVEKLV